MAGNCPCVHCQYTACVRVCVVVGPGVVQGAGRGLHQAVCRRQGVGGPSTTLTQFGASLAHLSVSVCLCLSVCVSATVHLINQIEHNSGDDWEMKTYFEML